MARIEVTSVQQDPPPSWQQLLRDRVRKFPEPKVMLFLPLNRIEHYHRCGSCGHAHVCNMPCKLSASVVSSECPEVLVDDRYVCFDCDEGTPVLDVSYWDKHFDIKR